MFYFLHIGKCAGTSFVSLASQNVAVYRPSSNGNPLNPLTGRLLPFWDWSIPEQQYFLSAGPWQFVANETGLGRKHEFFERVIYVVILREPLDRLFSAYQFLQAKPDPDIPLAERGHMFARFLAEKRGPHWRRNGLLASLTDEGRERPTERLELAKRRLAQFDHILLVEQLAEDVRTLACYGWEKLQLPWRNARAPGEPNWSAARAALERYPELLAALAQQNAEDLELYAYARKLVESRSSAVASLQRLPLPSGRAPPQSENFDFLVCCAYEFYLSNDAPRCLDVLRRVQESPAPAEFGLPAGEDFVEFALRQFGTPAAARRLHRVRRKQRKQERRPGA